MITENISPETVFVEKFLVTGADKMPNLMLKFCIMC